MNKHSAQTANPVSVCSFVSVTVTQTWYLLRPSALYSIRGLWYFIKVLSRVALLFSIPLSPLVLAIKPRVCALLSTDSTAKLHLWPSCFSIIDMAG